MHSPLKSNMEAVYKIIKYLKTTLDKGVMFQKNDDFKLEAYTDADWAGSMIDRRSTTGYCTFLEGHLVTLRSKKM